MKNSFLTLLLLFTFTTVSVAQTNITVSNSIADNILHGNYDPADYTPSTILNNPDSILHGIINDVSTYTLLAYLQKINSYYNRNSGSDTTSSTHGIGAVRRWIYSKFEEFSAANENRLVVSYLDFDKAICGMGHHRNVFCVLPGMDTTNKEILLVEGHFDTRCEGGCDTACYSPGMDDNGSGAVLVMELARIMSRYAFDHTIVFTTPTGEDQGLYGATAWANYIYSHSMPFMACFNNDVVGGTICGMTSSPPSCPGYNDIDSTHVRIFSYSYLNDSTRNSKHKQLARYIKLHQEERINPLLETPLTINIMIREDRLGRGGDQIPFRQKGYTAVRFCEQNENGDGTGTPPDRQHTTNDIIGLDTTAPPDGVIDTFFVDMRYLRRNIIANGVNLGFLAISPPQPAPVFNPLPDGVEIDLEGSDTLFKHYRVGIRSQGSGSLYFDTVMTFMNTHHLVINGLSTSKTYYISVMNVENSVESLISDEYSWSTVGIRKIPEHGTGINMNQNMPNPASETTTVLIDVLQPLIKPDAEIIIKDMTGRVMDRIPVRLMTGANKITYSNIKRLQGLFTYSLSVEGRIIQTRKMVLL
ncbi:MAG: M28 family peptidase [Bacteroidetes bacterium]|nr:M28 family peptidase [Bacteroidota bacterium]